MNELVKVTQQKVNNDAVQTVNARELHEFLCVGKDFSTWIKDRIEQFGFTENVDYICSPKSGNGIHAGLRTKINYHLTIDMAKELSMVERNEKGKQARQYFIEVERRYRQQAAIPHNFSEALLLAYEQAKQLEEQRPKVEFFDKAMSSADLMDMNEVVKTLNCGVGRNRLFKILIQEKIIFKRKKRYQPYQEQVDAGRFKLIEVPWDKPTEEGTEVCIYKKLMATQKGVEYIRRLLAEKKAA